MINTYVEITEKDINPLDLINRVRRPDAGAIVTFEGTVRNDSDGVRVTALYYEAYKEMAEMQIADLIDEAKKKYNILDAAVCHRIGLVGLTEDSVVISVSSAHRSSAFEACRYIIDTIKERVPIWKRDILENGNGSWH
ncbi:molybdopterin converting factor subunit 2 [Thermoplasma volcanium GSS1]|uniref:Molybdopterin synthase catalytic subunit n=1 Tax=Thermoplasma volcanium (strain ATCC 51530 / DSM 4299 / JCM 9571 / NBRC 15438 / GSS1) TaxID=273116 RepID=MOAE_THEVO|nr:molybdenum cofactor biosynthesis protein MoaE [Thermoplasma volcanium]Q97CL5.1 RecName: Full=Molybdopterin synthase catalytic subunit; AltName: Full=MPT synthase subunit 2; AltName: Full=Molybdenum cofactor biosynthesis protein E; AltName: Full=Molybdopterin-converting factor large subunit; AltName: Full=Molybdopterin-converting factor subunit 2 [Thermoplasma volcanium GSS1]BAB59228.1 molybdopterin converting factor subunit 2 [Thermoplasma volcanium GSS1]